MVTRFVKDVTQRIANLTRFTTRRAEFVEPISLENIRIAVTFDAVALGQGIGQRTVTIQIGQQVSTHRFTFSLDEIRVNVKMRVTGKFFMAVRIPGEGSIRLRPQNFDITFSIGQFKVTDLDAATFRREIDSQVASRMVELGLDTLDAENNYLQYRVDLTDIDTINESVDFSIRYESYDVISIS